MIAIDSNVFVAAVQTGDTELRRLVRKAVAGLRRQAVQLVCFPQNLVEFWSVATRPLEHNGLGLTIEHTVRFVDRFQMRLQLLPETAELFPMWRELVLRYRVSGK